MSEFSLKQADRVSPATDRTPRIRARSDVVVYQVTIVAIGHGLLLNKFLPMVIGRLLVRNTQNPQFTCIVL